MHPFVTQELAAQHLARLRKEADDAHLAVAARSACGAKSGRLHLRPLDLADLKSIAALFERLSWRSRYLRFMSPREVPPATVLYFASVDHARHEAVGAFDKDHLVGSAHYFRSREDPSEAEIAAEVIDGYQGKGIGSCLLHELARLARPRGITHFSATVLAENTAALGLVRNSGWPSVTRQDGPVLDIRTAIAST
jgi:GNAT superfamily N-acetyltransferase